MATIKISWRGDDLVRKLQTAARWGIDKTMSEAVQEAKDNHPGWIYRSGLAEGSIQIQQEATTFDRRTRGLWGSKGVEYMKKLEYDHGSALRNASLKHYPSLARHIKTRFEKKASPSGTK